MGAEGASGRKPHTVTGKILRPLSLGEPGSQLPIPADIVLPELYQSSNGPRRWSASLNVNFTLKRGRKTHFAPRQALKRAGAGCSIQRVFLPLGTVKKLETIRQNSTLVWPAPLCDLWAQQECENDGWKPWVQRRQVIGAAPNYNWKTWKELRSLLENPSRTVPCTTCALSFLSACMCERHGTP